MPGLLKSFDFIQETGFSRNRVLSIIALGLLAVIIKWEFPDVYGDAISVYLHYLGGTASFLLLTFGVSHQYFPDIITLVDTHFLATKVDTMFLSLKLFLLIIILLLLTQSSKKLVMQLPILFLSAFFFNVSRIMALVLYSTFTHHEPGFNHHSGYMVLLLSIPVFFIHKTIENEDRFISKKLAKQVFKVGMIFLVFYFSKFVYSFFPTLDQFIKNSLASFLLHISQKILLFLDFDVFIAGRKISNGLTWVGIGDPCIGINISIVFAAFILTTRTHFWAKTLYAIGGILFIFLLNAIRITLLFAYIKEAGSNTEVVHKHHDMYNFAIYLIVIVLWFFWFFLLSGGQPKVINQLTSKSH